MSCEFPRKGGGRTGHHLLLLLVLVGAWCEALVVRCPQVNPKDTSMATYCFCGKRSSVLNITCDFRNKEAVELTQELMAPFLNTTLTRTYVRMVNTTAVHVSSGFMKAWHQVPSAAFDIWHGGNLTIESTPPPDDPNKLAGFRTFAGVGIVGCNIQEIPPKFLRDRTRGGFRIKSCNIANISAGFLHNIQQMRYLVIQNSLVDLVAGPVTSEGYVTLSRRHVHSWNGLLLANSTLHTLAPGAFNLTHQSDMESVELRECRVGQVGTGALTMAGDLTVIIQDNYFARLEKKAFKVAVTGPVTFNHNQIRSWAVDALEDFICHNRTALESNTVTMDRPLDLIHNESITPFHTSCGNPQLFLVITQQRPLIYIVNTSAAWTLGAVLMVVVVLAVALTGTRHLGTFTPGYRSAATMFPILLNGRQNKTSLENLPQNAELGLLADYHDDEEGVDAAADRV